MIQEQLNKRLVISLVLLSAVTVVLFFMNASGKKSDLDKSIFKVDDQINIDNVVLERATEKIKLTYNKTIWQVNDFEADRQLIKVFFAAILQAEPKRKLSTAKSDSVSTLMKERGTHVTLWEGPEVRKDFYVLGNSQKSETYYQLAESSDVYMVTIPGYRVYLASIFDLSQEDWRDKRIFNFNWQNFKSLSASFPADVKQNFTISFKDQYFTIDGLVNTDTTKLNDYLDAISLIRAEQIVSGPKRSSYDSLLTGAPDFQISVEDIASRAIRLDVFVRAGQFIGKWDEKELVLFNSATIQPISKGRSYFINP